MKEQELMKLSKIEIIRKYNHLFATYNNTKNRYRELRADMMIIKRQISSIAENIQMTTHDKGNATIRYYPGGKQGKVAKE